VCCAYLFFFELSSLVYLEHLRFSGIANQ
jgi:hypothetical protein